jgi:serine/threonine protein phosphatase PrpC
MIPIEKGKILNSVQRHAGAAGKHNQDRYALQAFQIKEGNNKETFFAVLADGVGGQRVGDVAAEMAVDIILHSVSQSQASQASSILQAAILRAGQAIVAQSETIKELRGMGSTALCAWIVDRKLYTASVGNSCLYLLRGGHLIQLNVVSVIETTDQLEEEDEEPESENAGFLGARLREKVDLRLVLSGDESERSIRNQGTLLKANDRLLLCNDGLSKALEDSKIAELFSQSRIEDAASTLVQAAVDGGSEDNLTAIAIALPPGNPLPASRQIASRRALRVGLAAFLLVLFSLVGWYFLGPQLNPNLTPLATAINTLTPIP